MAATTVGIVSIASSESCWWKMAWLNLIPCAKIPWKLVGHGVLIAALYVCWQDRVAANARADAWSRAAKSSADYIIQMEKQRVQENKLAADSLKKSEAERKQLADA